MFGGNLEANEIYKNIKSIGFEFETHDLSKLLLFDDDTLINTDLTPRTLRASINNGDASQMNQNYYKIKDKNFNYYEFFDIPEFNKGSIDGKYNVMMNIGTDIGENDFSDELQPYCNNTDIKNELYTYKIKNKENKEKKTYNIIFTDNLTASSCQLFAAVEYIITYYHPERNNNIILETFSNACQLIQNHLDKLQEIDGKLLIHNTKIINKKLYHFPNTNLFYLKTIKKDINKIAIIPQMTLRVDCKFFIPVIKQIAYNKIINNKAKKELYIDYKNIIIVENLVDELINNFNGTKAQQHFIKHNPFIKTYLFMIFYKIFMYFKYWEPLKNKDKYYFKDFLTFAPRHENVRLLYKILEVLNHAKAFEESNVYYEFIILINNPPVLKKYLKIPKSKIIFIQNKDDFEFGNIKLAFLSYFENLYLKKDFFSIYEFSTFYSIPNDGTVLVENRGFYVELQAFAKDEMNVSLKKYPYLENFYKLTQKLITENKVRNLNDRVWNDATQRYNKPKTKKTTLMKIKSTTRKVRQ
jgi:hypothetical protein